MPLSLAIVAEKGWDMSIVVEGGSEMKKCDRMICYYLCLRRFLKDIENVHACGILTDDYLEEWCTVGASDVMKTDAKKTQTSVCALDTLFRSLVQ